MPLPVVPKPATIHPLPGECRVSPAARVATSDPALADVARQLASVLGASVGDAGDGPDPAAITIAREPALPVEGYALHVSPESIRLSASAAPGAFYGVQTLRQLARRDRSGVVVVPAVRVEDAPRFPWRGYLLDSGRHFMTVDFVKRMIDLLAYHKLNRFHWHLTDDQGWRVEIRRYPKLAGIGAWRKDDRQPSGTYGGFYTQAELRGVVAYAAERHVHVVPEIEMPGHAGGALAAYPELSCTGGPFEVGTRWGVYDDIFCAGRDETFAFLENVLDEVLDVFPSQYIHIGADEAPKARWKRCPRCQQRIRDERLKDENELQTWFVHRVGRFLASRGRKLVAWDEILEGGIPPGATLQAWRSMDAARRAVELGHDAIVSPTSHCYFDYPLDAADVMKVYAFDPIPTGVTPPDRRARILGPQANMWTEYAPQDTIDRKTFPRLCSLAEVAWSPAATRDAADYRARLTPHVARLRAMGVDVGPWAAPKLEGGVDVGTWTPDRFGPEPWNRIEWDVTPHLTGPGKWGAELKYARGAHGVNIAWVALLEDGREVARDTHDGWSGGASSGITYVLNVPATRPGATYALVGRLRGHGGTDSTGTVRFGRAIEPE